MISRSHLVLAVGCVSSSYLTSCKSPVPYNIRPPRYLKYGMFIAFTFLIASGLATLEVVSGPIDGIPPGSLAYISAVDRPQTPI
jgi:hypothetical protein